MRSTCTDAPCAGTEHSTCAHTHTCMRTHTHTCMRTHTRHTYPPTRCHSPAALPGILGRCETAQVRPESGGLSWPSTKRESATFSLAGSAVPRVGLPEHTLPLAGAGGLSARGRRRPGVAEGECLSWAAPPPFGTLRETELGKLLSTSAGLLGTSEPQTDPVPCTGEKVSPSHCTAMK